MNVAMAFSSVEGIESIRDVVSQLPAWARILAYALWFIGTVCLICVMHMRVRRVAKCIEEATGVGRPPLAIPEDIHPAVLAMVGGSGDRLVLAFTATVQRLAIEGVFVSNTESERLRHASLDVRNVPNELNPIDKAAIRIVQELSRAEVEDRSRYEHYSRVFFKDYCASFENFQNCVQQAYNQSPFLLKSTFHLHGGLFLLYLSVSVVLAFLLSPDVYFLFGVLLFALVGLMAIAIEVSNLQKCGELNAEGTCLLKQMNDEKRWCTYFAAGKTSDSLDIGDLMRISVYAAACDCLEEFSAGLLRSRNTSSLSLVPGMQLVVPRGDERGRCSLAIYVESVMCGLRSAVSIADDESIGKIMAEYSRETGKVTGKVLLSSLISETLTRKK